MTIGKSLVILAATALLMATATQAQEAAATKSAASEWEKMWNRISVETLWYLKAGKGENDGQSYSKTGIARGYVTLKFKLADWFEPRVTFDTHQDDAGDFKVRLKYMYGKFKLPIETAIITEPNVEFGLVHGPWFDYEEHINHFRMQGTMLIERNGVLNSADAGITVGALFGKKLPNEYQKKVSKKYPGQYGSIAFGLYNGGGYHAKENNDSKVFESRISVRPFGNFFPNLQLSHFFIYGKGNQSESEGMPDWLLNAVMASFEHEYFVVTGQYATGKGNQKGDKLANEGNAKEFDGFSGFAEIKIPPMHTSLIGRYDSWDWGDVTTTRFIAGIAYHFLGHNTLLLDLDHATTEAVEGEDDKTDWLLNLTLQVTY